MARSMLRWVLLMGLLVAPVGCTRERGEDRAASGEHSAPQTAAPETVESIPPSLDTNPRVAGPDSTEQEMAAATGDAPEQPETAAAELEVRSFAIRPQPDPVQTSPRRIQTPLRPLSDDRPQTIPDENRRMTQRSFQAGPAMMPRSFAPQELPRAAPAPEATGDSQVAEVYGAEGTSEAAPSGEASTASAGNGNPPAEDAEYQVVEVFYGTDRKPVDVVHPAGPIAVPPAYFPAMGVAAIALASLLASVLLARRRALLAVIGVFCLLGAAALGAQTHLKLARNGLAHAEKGRVYGNDRGELELGTCQVSIPRIHEVGRLESPSILRLEFREDARKHVMLREATPRGHDEFYTKLRQRVAESPQQDLFVFVHGYNVTFEDAARRTAQIAYDLKFPGAAVFFSWPSQGGLLKYKVDESNVQWTVPHLKQFLLEIAEKSGASAVNLVAHSMGNRALTDALRQLRYEMRHEVLFHQVVLAAPDIDAEVFRRDIAPAIQSTARRVTLYASSDDQALIASKNVHGYPRAGDSGSGLVVIPGMETIDVSGIDTSLLGHSYYGSSHPILADLYEVIRRAQPPSARRWLKPARWNGLIYWRLHADTNEVARPANEASRY